MNTDSIIKFPFSYYTVRFNDCDLLGHLNNSRYIDYFINAREDHLRNCYAIRLNDFYLKGQAWVVSSHAINYLQPAIYNEIVYIQSYLIKYGDDFLNLEMKMMDELRKDLKATLLTKLIYINLKSGKRQRHTDEFMEFIRRIEVTASEIHSHCNAVPVIN